MLNFCATARGAHAADVPELGKLMVVSTFTFESAKVTSPGDRSDSRPLRAPSGSILLGTRNGFLLELDPASSNKIVSKKKLAGGIAAALARFSEKGQERIVVGTGSGFHCFDAKGNELSRMTNFNSVLQAPPIVHDNQVFFLADDGLPYKLDTTNSSLVPQSDGIQWGTAISNPALVLAPEPTLIYGTERSGSGDASIYSVIYAPIARKLLHYDLSAGYGAPTFTPTVIQARYGVSTETVVLILTDEGKLLFGNEHGLLSSRKLVDLRGEPTTPLFSLANQVLFTICIDSVSKKARIILLNLFGDELSRNSICNFDHSIIEATPTSEATVFQDLDQRMLSIMGFSDKTVKVVDIQTGICVASIKMDRLVEAPPTSLGEHTFFVGEEPDGQTIHCQVLKFTRNLN